MNYECVVDFKILIDFISLHDFNTMHYNVIYISKP